MEHKLEALKLAIQGGVSGEPAEVTIARAREFHSFLTGRESVDRPQAQGIHKIGDTFAYLGPNIKDAVDNRGLG